MNKLIMLGGSVSDYYGDSITQTFGQVAAEKLQYEYVHYALHRAGNDTMYKSVTDDIIQNKVGPGDIVLFQFGMYTRLELPSPVPWTEDYILGRESCVGNYTIFPWSPNNFYEIAEEASYKQYFETLYKDMEVPMSVCTEFYFHDWMVKSVMFQGLLESKGIRCVPILHRCIDPDLVTEEVLQQFLTEKNYKNMFREDQMWLDTIDQSWPTEKYMLGMDTVCGEDPQEFDREHYNQDGHQLVGEKIYQHISKRRGIL